MPSRVGYERQRTDYGSNVRSAENPSLLRDKSCFAAGSRIRFFDINQFHGRNRQIDFDFAINMKPQSTNGMSFRSGGLPLRRLCETVSAH